MESYRADWHNCQKESIESFTENNSLKLQWFWRLCQSALQPSKYYTGYKLQFRKKIIEYKWKHPSLSELTSNLFYMELGH